MRRFTQSAGTRSSRAASPLRAARPAAARRGAGWPGGVAAVRGIAGGRPPGARLGAYAHNPYALNPGESPWSGGCGNCETITMSTLERLLANVQRAWGPKRIWLTEFGYQTNPPDQFLGVSKATQARYLADAALRAYLAPRVD